MPGRELRILVTCAVNFDYPSGKHVRWLAEELVRQGHAVMVASGVALSTPADVAPGGDLRSHQLSPRGRTPSATDVRAVRAFGPDLVYAFTSRLLPFGVGRAFARAAGIPLFVHFEEDEWALRRRALVPANARLRVRSLRDPAAWPPSTRATLRQAAREAAGFDALTSPLAELVRRRTGRACTVVAPASPAVWPAPEHVVFGPGMRGRRIIGFSGATFDQRQADLRLLFSAVSRLQRRGLRVGLAHSGAVTATTPLHELAAQAGLEHGSLEAFGYLPAEAHQGLLRAADVLVQPGLNTPINVARLPSKLQTYLASGTPTVTFGFGYGELLQDRTEVLKTFTDDPGELAARIEEALTDVGLREALERGGPAAAGRLFNPAANTGRLVEHFRSAMVSPGWPSRA